MPPSQGWMVLNSDGAAKGSPGSAGGGGLIRDHTRRLQIAYSMNYGSCRSFVAEVHAVDFGIELAKRMGSLKLQIQMDNLVVIWTLQGTDNYGGECTHIIHHCRKIITDGSWEVEIIHVYREGNRHVDWLANQGINQNNNIELIQVPPFTFR